jgi:hypothetical protein
MAITIQGPLAAQLFQLGGASNVGGGDEKFKGKADVRPKGFDSAPAPTAPPIEQGEDTSGGQAKALAAAAQMGLSMYMKSKSGAVAPDANGNGYGLGGNLVSGDAGNASFAGTQQASLFSPSTGVQMPKDNGYRSANPYALDYSNNKQSPTLFNYGGHYGGATY